MYPVEVYSASRPACALHGPAVFAYSCDVPGGMDWTKFYQRCACCHRFFSTPLINSPSSYSKAGIIEKSAIEGQQTYQRELDRDMRLYIREHKTEFIPAGLDLALVVAALEGEAEVPTTPTGPYHKMKQCAKRNAIKSGISAAFNEHSMGLRHL